MAGQGMDRREVLRAMAMAAAASRFPGFSRWAFACDHTSGGAVAATRAEYAPRFFTQAEYAALECLTELIIPSDGSPGAREAGVSEFIDFMVASDPPLQYRFRYGLTWLDSRALEMHARPFRELAGAEQAEMLGYLAYKERFRPGEDDGRAFFALLREYTVMGYYTSRVGLEQLDFPGLKFYAGSPGCPHTGDPEHRNTGQSHQRAVDGQWRESS